MKTHTLIQVPQTIIFPMRTLKFKHLVLSCENLDNNIKGNNKICHLIIILYFCVSLLKIKNLSYCWPN
ncbi:hypothetical protein Lalb_Chr15g0083091 [Lupinus albus]|uniref:Uncharacterized protein n=1 Tax=Lupinus albus TaxID=3870 RepID=A0A6A4NYH5_LUPAL|nr:hypothetical protein Lalb_Chr15g0083091 [Lupinus albus]